MKRIRQFERTDRDITNALFSLMGRKSFEKITVQDILDESLINRSTFYLHFPDKYAVLEREQEKLLSELTVKTEGLLSQEKPDLQQINEAFFSFLAENRPRIRLLLSVRTDALNLRDQMQDFFAAYFLKTSTCLSDFEGSLLAGLTVDFLIRFLELDRDGRELSSDLLDAWLNLNLFFFRIEDVPEAKVRLLSLVGEMHREQRF